MNKANIWMNSLEESGFDMVAFREKKIDRQKKISFSFYLS